jgi:hypothetical protein
VQRCPNCGYRERYDWPAMLWVVAFGLLYFVFVAVAARNFRFTGLVAFLLFLMASTWNMLRNERNRREYLKSQGISQKLPSQ